MNDLLRIRSLSKHYDGFDLRNVDLTVPAGSVVGFIGSNGAGKTTTIKAILGLIYPDAGSIELLGQNVGEHERQQHAEHGDGEGERAGRERYDARSVEAYGEMADKRKPRHNGVDDASGRIRCDAESDASGDDDGDACVASRHYVCSRKRQSLAKGDPIAPLVAQQHGHEHHVGHGEAGEQDDGSRVPRCQAYARCKERPQRHVLRQRFRQSEEIGKHHGLHGALLFRPLELALLVQLGGDYG